MTKISSTFQILKPSEKKAKYQYQGINRWQNRDKTKLPNLTTNISGPRPRAGHRTTPGWSGSEEEIPKKNTWKIRGVTHKRRGRFWGVWNPLHLLHIYSLKMFCNLSDDTITIAVDEKLTLNVAILFHIPRIARSRQYPKTWSYPWKFCAKKEIKRI